MTRRNKCDACRKAKIKCDESLSQCSNCVRQGKACTHEYYNKKEFKFVEVKGEIIEVADSHAGLKQMGASQDAVTRSEKRKLAVITTQRPSSSTSARGKVMRPPASEMSQVNLFSPRCEGTTLLARWAFSTRGYIEHVDCYSGWSAYVPYYLGRSEAINKAACCFMECRQAIANPTEANLRALRSANVHAVRSVRQALERKESRACTGDILLAIQLLYAVEASVMHNPVAFVIHVEGLMDLLKEQNKHLRSSDDQEKSISRIIFQSTYATGFVPAMFAGTNHKLDDPEWLTAPLLIRTIPGICNSTAQKAWTRVAHSFILIPRLARLVRLLVASANDGSVEKEAVDLAQHLFTNTVDAEFFAEAMASGELRLEPTVLTETIEAVPMSYHIGSVRLYVLLTSYWACRLFICGLVEALYIAAPFATLLFDEGLVHDEDTRVATDALMAVQHTITAVATAVDKTPYRSDEMRLLLLLQAAFGSWYRLERRLEGWGEGLGKETLERATRMKRLCLDMVNRLLVASQGTPARELDLVAYVNLYSGGPVWQVVGTNGS